MSTTQPASFKEEATQVTKVPHSGINRRELDAIFRATGGTIEYVRRTGELRYRHRILPRVVRASARRKGASLSLVCFVRDVCRLLAGVRR